VSTEFERRSLSVSSALMNEGGRHGIKNMITSALSVMS
jgi:hypothetical protein